MLRGRRDACGDHRRLDRRSPAGRYREIDRRYLRGGRRRGAPPLIKRVETGVERAQNQGKWLGALPKGFERDDDGYLRVLLDPDQDAGEVGYLEVRRALERIEAGESYRAVTRDLPNLTRQTLMNIHKDPERRRWYLETEADDERVDAALESVR